MQWLGINLKLLVPVSFERFFAKNTMFILEQC